jgi:RimJ/RimL family protein N-acetyltransferase
LIGGEWAGRLAGVTVFETDRLIVRPWTHDDADLDRLYDIYSRWEVARWLGADPKPMASRDLAPGVVDRWNGRSDPDPAYGIWAVEVRDTGVVAGTVLLVPLPTPEGGEGGGEVEVGWHFHPDSWGLGYATEAARGAIARGFAAGLSEIYAVVYPGNDPSVAVCRRLGMTPIGRTDRWYGMELEAFVLKREDERPAG